MWTSPRTWVTSELVSSAIMNVHVRDNLNALRRIDYVERTSNYTHTGTSEGTSAAIITGTTLTYTAGERIRVEVFGAVQDYGASGAMVVFLIYEGATVKGRIGLTQGPTSVGASVSSPVFGRVEFVSAGGSLAISWKSYVGAGTPGALNAGVGGSGAYLPASLSVYACGV